MTQWEAKTLQEAGLLGREVTHDLDGLGPEAVCVFKAGRRKFVELLGQLSQSMAALGKIYAEAVRDFKRTGRQQQAKMHQLQKDPKL